MAAVTISPNPTTGKPSVDYKEIYTKINEIKTTSSEYKYLESANMSTGFLIKRTLQLPPITEQITRTYLILRILIICIYKIVKVHQILIFN